VVAALDAGLDRLREQAGAVRLELVGYSGGGVLAALLAARRDDVARLVTVSAPLALRAWRDHHQLGPIEAEDPAALPAGRLDALAQVHFAGARDDVVPPFLLERFRAARPAAHDLVVRVEDVDHGGWLEGWAARIASTRPGSAAAR
jgi:pimeloyl-ACP methyl ester carboxylesterase